MSDNNTSVTVGPGLPGLLFLTFLILKLTDVIAWSWWWVTAPLWGGVAILVGFMLGVAAIAGIVVLVKAHADRKAAKRRAERRKEREKGRNRRPISNTRKGADSKGSF